MSTKKLGFVASLYAVAILLGIGSIARAAETEFRPPSVPPVTFNPYLSIWSNADKLTDDNTRHWTRHEHSLSSMIRIDGKAFRLMGKAPATIPAFPQKSLKVTPTRSIYEFDDGQVHVTLTFMTAALPDDLDALSLPLSYITWDIHSVDGHEHEISLFDSTSGLLAVNSPKQKVEWKRGTYGPSLTAMHIGTEAQPILGRMGDDTRIDWGYAYAAADAEQTSAAIGEFKRLATEFEASGKLPANDGTTAHARAAKDREPVDGVRIRPG